MVLWSLLSIEVAALLEEPALASSTMVEVLSLQLVSLFAPPYGSAFSTCLSVASVVSDPCLSYPFTLAALMAMTDLALSYSPL